ARRHRPVHLHRCHSPQRFREGRRRAQRRRIHPHRPRPDHRRQTPAFLAPETESIHAGDLRAGDLRGGRRPAGIHTTGRRRGGSGCCQPHIHPRIPFDGVSDLVELLASVDPFSQLGSEELAALAERAEIVRLAAGETLFHQGDPGDRAYVVLEGNLEVSAPGPLEPLVLNILGPGDLVGEVSLLRGGARSATVTARTDVELAAIGPDDLRDSVGAGSGALMRTLLDRWEQTQHVVLRGERLAQLGTLAAGVAHELNNPAAAVRRSSEVLVDTIRRIGSAVTDLVEADLGPEAARCLRRLVVEELETAVSDPLARASAERAVSDLLTDLGVDDPWNLASDVLDAGMGVEDVQRLAAEVGAERFVSLLELLASIVSARRLAGEIGWAAGHMSQVAQDLSSYSRLGEAPVQDV